MHAFQTTQEPLLCFQNDSISQFNQLAHPHVTQQTRPICDNMDTKLNYGKTNYWEDMIEDFLDNTNISGTSHQ